MPRQVSHPSTNGASPQLSLSLWRAAKFHLRSSLFSFRRPKKINHLILDEVKVEDLNGLELIINTIPPAMLSGDQDKSARPLIKTITLTSQ